jgi:hypothetical protein
MDVRPAFSADAQTSEAMEPGKFPTRAVTRPVGMAKGGARAVAEPVRLGAVQHV